MATGADKQQDSRLAGDGAGGVIAVWIDRRNLTDFDLYAQRFNAFGIEQWTPGGLAVCTATGDQVDPTVIPDGSGGVYIAWLDGRAGNIDVYVQHVSQKGDPQWVPDGTVVCDDPADQGHFSLGGPQLIRSDGAAPQDTGVIVTWEDYRGNVIDIYARRVTAAGALWTSNGVAICTAAEAQFNPQIVPDYTGGAIIAWEDQRNDAGDIYAQGVNVAGAVQWAANGVGVCTDGSKQTYPCAVSDGAGSAYIAWMDYRGALFTELNVYSQRMSINGVALWTPGGVQVGADWGLSSPYKPDIVADGSGGCIITWVDYRLGHYDVWAQRLNSTAVKQWLPLDGVRLVDMPGNDLDHHAAPDGAGGAFVTWFRFSPGKIWLQHVDATGALGFGTSGWLVNDATSADQTTPSIATNSSDPPFIAWTDFRTGPDSDVYITRKFVTVSGASPPAPSALNVRAYPNPFSTSTELLIGAPGAGDVVVDVYDVAGRRVARRMLTSGVDGRASLLLDGSGDDGKPLPSGVYLVRVATSTLTRTTKLVLTR